MIVCPKCKKTSGDDWSRCGTHCPMGGPVKSSEEQLAIVDKMEAAIQEVTDGIFIDANLDVVYARKEGEYFYVTLSKIVPY